MAHPRRMFGSSRCANVARSSGDSSPSLLRRGSTTLDGTVWMASSSSEMLTVVASASASRMDPQTQSPSRGTQTLLASIVDICPADGGLFEWGRRGDVPGSWARWNVVTCGSVTASKFRLNIAYSCT